MIASICDRHGGRLSRVSALLCALVGWVAMAPAAGGSSDVQCTHHTSDRQAFFGDLHIHTGVSADAMLFGTRNRPDDAYAFARGKEIFVFQEKMTLS